MLVTRKSPISGKEKTYDLPVTEQQLHCYNTGKSSLEHCFPQLTPSQRAFIESGVTDEEWDTVLPDTKE